MDSIPFGNGCILLPLIVVQALSVVPLADIEIPKWNDASVVVGGNDESGNQGTSDDQPSTGPDDKYIYQSRVACTEGDQAIFPTCATVMPECLAGGEDGKPGTAIYWYASLKGAASPVWVFHSGPVCVFGEKPRDLLAEIAGQIASEFQRLPIAAAEFGSQPGPHTLRGKETNVWANASTQTFNLTMIGQKVTITATPVAYTWSYGDGTIWGPTPIHGAPLNKDRIGEQTQTSHVYTETGRLTIGLITHFNGTYTVNGGPELPIPGQGNIPSASQPLTVWRAETNLYADDCIVNPNGIGC
ncbi:hypothetical protein [Arthrobacter sp. N199823]|uniref:hypothetical protein n=1 Tax=Arthrobacter sp. N199823 TaxID=2058895 RepID=UPI0021574EC5|nr:hypothetical protein [Arthrobacter sp. N199823]